MKISRIPLFFLLVMFIFFQAAYALEFNLKFSGGLSFFHSDAINRVLNDWKTWEEKNAENRSAWSYLGGDVLESSRGFDFEGEILLSFHPRLMLSVGSGFYYGEVKPEQAELFILKPAGEFSYIHPYTLSAFPAILSGYYLHPLSEKMRFYLKAGAGLVWAKFFERAGYKNVDVIRYTYSLDQNSRSRSPVFAGGAGLLFETEPGINFFLEGSFRWARISDFQGENLEGQSGDLYYLEEYDPDFDLWQAKFLILPGRPEAENTRAVKKAVIDLSGFSLKLGIMIRF